MSEQDWTRPVVVISGSMLAVALHRPLNQYNVPSCTCGPHCLTSWFRGRLAQTDRTTSPCRVAFVAASSHKLVPWSVGIDRYIDIQALIRLRCERAACGILAFRLLGRHLRGTIQAVDDQRLRCGSDAIRHWRWWQREPGLRRCPRTDHGKESVLSARQVLATPRLDRMQGG